jgi:Raf kinase inhibitor-like YbhB/YbcL family protein
MSRALLLYVFALVGCGDKDDSGDASDGTDATDGADGTDGTDGADGTDGTDGSDGTTSSFAISLPAATSSAGHPNAAECDWQLSADYECAQPNPAIEWVDIPAEAAVLVLIFDDPDAGNFQHWAMVNIPATETGLAAAISGNSVTNTPPGDAYELENGVGWDGYLGSCPPAPHTYRWRLWAVSEPLPSELSTFADVAAAAESVSIDMAETCHVYGPRTEG